jgi:eukaryotic-like serine/threonine-protein kinase
LAPEKGGRSAGTNAAGLGLYPRAAGHSPKEINPKNEKVNTISIGTLGYTPPEQFAGRPNFTSDIYALGMTAIEAATNHSPRDIEDVDNNLQWRHLAPIDKSLADIIDKMVVFESISRYQSANEVLKDLQMLKNN